MDFLQNDYISEIVELVRERKDTQSLLEALESYHENDIAEALESLTREERIALYTAMGVERVSEVFAYLEDATAYFEEIELEKAAEIIENMDSDDAVDILENMDEEIGEKLVSLLDEESMHDIRLIQSYEEDEIGSKMTTNFISIRKGMTVKEAMKEMVAQAEDNDNIYTVYVYNEDNDINFLYDVIYSAREIPSMYSITINCICSLKPTSNIFTILGCERRAMAFDSFLNLRKKSSLPANSFFRIFTATILSSVISFALKISAIPPVPMSSISS